MNLIPISDMAWNSKKMEKLETFQINKMPATNSCNQVIFLKNHCSVLSYIQNIFWYGPKMTVYYWIQLCDPFPKIFGPAQNSFGPIEAQDTRQQTVVLKFITIMQLDHIRFGKSLFYFWPIIRFLCFPPNFKFSVSYSCSLSGAP